MDRIISIIKQTKTAAPSAFRRREAKQMADPILQIPARLCGDPRLVSAAKTLGIAKAHLIGNITHLLCQVAEHAEDGDLWRGDEDASVRFTAALADWPREAAEFAFALRREEWIVEWMIADWLKFAGDYLYRKYKSSNRNRLVEIYAKNGREYGKGRGGGKSETSQVHPWGCFRDVNGMVKNHPQTLNPSTPNETEKQNDPTAPNPSTQKKKKIENPEGVVGGDKDVGQIVTIPDWDFFNYLQDGLWDRGIATTLDQLDGSGLTHLEVFEAFKPVFVFHSLVTLQSFYFRCARCDCTPAWWTMIYMDKVHAVYRERPDGKPWLEEGADPVALTMAATLPSYGRRHSPTEAARQLFLEIMIDYQRNRNGESSRWAGCITGSFIAKELDLRKGKAGKIA
jgi:hypothetical protein